MQPNIIFMVNMKLDNKPGRTDAYKYSIESWKRWGEKNNSEVFVLTEPLIDPKEMSPTWQRYYLFELLKNSDIKYDQILMVDSDTIISPYCPNFFEITERKYCGIANVGSYDWLFRSIENYSKYLFDGNQIDFLHYINGGMQIVNNIHKSFFDVMIEFYHKNKEQLLKMQNTFHVGTDQTVLNFLLNIYNIDLKILPYEFNMQDLALREGLILLDDDTPLFTKYGFIYHFNAIPGNTNSKISNFWMKKTFEYFYKKEPK